MLVEPFGGIALPTAEKRDEKLWAAAQDLESAFLAEMLRTAGLGKPPEGFGGGIGEEQFASLLADEQARAFTARGGIGLAEHIFNAMKERQA